MSSWACSSSATGAVVRPTSLARLGRRESDHGQELADLLALRRSPRRRRAQYPSSNEVARRLAASRPPRRTWSRSASAGRAPSGTSRCRASSPPRGGRACRCPRGCCRARGRGGASPSAPGGRACRTSRAPRAPCSRARNPWPRPGPSECEPRRATIRAARYATPAKAMAATPKAATSPTMNFFMVFPFENWNTSPPIAYGRRVETDVPRTHAGKRHVLKNMFNTGNERTLEAATLRARGRKWWGLTAEVLEHEMHAERAACGPPGWCSASGSGRENRGSRQDALGDEEVRRPVPWPRLRGELRARVPEGPGTDAAHRLIRRGWRSRVVVGCRRLLAMVGTARKRLRPAELRAGQEQADQEEGEERSHGNPRDSTSDNLPSLPSSPGNSKPVFSVIQKHRDDPAEKCRESSPGKTGLAEHLRLLSRPLSGPDSLGPSVTID